MITEPNIIILPAQNCRRSRKVMTYLDERRVPYTAVPLESPEGVELAEQYHLCACRGMVKLDRGPLTADRGLRGGCARSLAVRGRWSAVPFRAGRK